MKMGEVGSRKQRVAKYGRARIRGCSAAVLGVGEGSGSCSLADVEVERGGWGDFGVVGLRLEILM